MFAIAYGENEFMSLQMKGLVWGMGQALLKSPRGRNASWDGFVKLGWVHCLSLTLHNVIEKLPATLLGEFGQVFFS